MQKMIPFWLIMFGALLITKNISTLIQRLMSFKTKSVVNTSVVVENHQSSMSTILNVFDSFMTLFLIIWFICGNIWVYSNLSRVQFSDHLLETTFCSKLTFMFSFWMITSIYLLVALGCVFFCCTICFTIFLPTNEWWIVALLFLFFFFLNNFD
jgi:hypothetical protein